MIRLPDYHTRLLPAVILLVAAVKLVLVLRLGPALLEDSALYLRLGQMVLDVPAWWRESVWGPGHAPDSLQRPYGYPLLIAGARLVAGESSLALLVLLQSAASLGVLVLFGLFLVRVVAAPWLRVALVVLCGLSDFLLFDLSILTDSLHASLVIAVFLLIGVHLTGTRPARPASVLAIGLLWAVAMTLRDTAWYHAVLPLAGVVVLCRGHRLGRGAAIRSIALFAAPVLACYLAVVGWNEYRTGHPFFSITGGINWLWPGVNIRDHGLGDPFTCPDPVCAAARTVPADKGMRAVFAIADAIQARQPLDPLAFGRLTFDHYIGVVRSAPLAYGLSVLANLQYGHLAHLLFDPLSNLNEAFRLHPASGDRVVDGIREQWAAVRQGNVAALAVMAGLIGLDVASYAALAVTLGVAPVLALRHRRRDGAVAVTVLYFWCAAGVFLGSYCLLHLEMRHAMPAVPLLLTVFGYAVGTGLAPRPCADADLKPGRASA